MKRIASFLIVTISLLVFDLPPRLALATSTNQGLNNPIGTNTMLLGDVLLRLTKFTLGIIALLSVATFVYGGAVMLTSGGNPEKLKKAKDTLVWAVFGLATMLLSYSFLNLVFNVIAGSATP